MNDAPIGVYDSGLGGLTVWRELRRQLPGESLLYLGDGKNCPYGGRPARQVQRFADQAFSSMRQRGAKMIVVACNAATAAAISFLRARYPELPIVGMEPAVKPAALSSRSGVVGVLATAAALQGELFRRTAARYAGRVRILTAVGEEFVELVEADQEESPRALEAVRRALEPMLAAGADRIVLGCTHYPFLEGAMRQVIAGREAELIDPAPAVARRAAQLLDRYGLRAAPGREPRYEFLTFADEGYLRRLEAKALACL